MDDLPKITFKDYKLFKEQFPPSSTDQRWNLRWARLTPIWIRDDTDIYAQNQNNWTNLFLWQKLGPKILPWDAQALGNIHEILEQCNHIDAVNEERMKEIKEHNAVLSEEMTEIKEVIETLSTKGDLTQVKKIIEKKLKSGTPEERISKLNSKIDQMSKKLDKVIERLGIN